MSLYEGIPTKKATKKESWAPIHASVFGEEPHNIHDSVFGKTKQEQAETKKEEVPNQPAKSAPIHESVFGAGARPSEAPIHDSVFGVQEPEAETIALEPEVESGVQARESVESNESSKGPAKKEEDLAAVKERLGIPPTHTEPEQPERTRENPDFTMWSDPAYKEIRSVIFERNREKEPLLIDLQAEREYARVEPEKFAEHESLERDRIYRAADGTPDISNDRTFERMFLPREYGGKGFFRTQHLSEMNARRKLILMYPNKAKAYAETDPMLQRMFNGDVQKNAA